MLEASERDIYVRVVTALLEYLDLLLQDIGQQVKGEPRSSTYNLLIVFCNCLYMYPSN